MYIIFHGVHIFLGTVDKIFMPSGNIELVLDEALSWGNRIHFSTPRDFYLWVNCRKAFCLLLVISNFSLLGITLQQPRIHQNGEKWKSSCCIPIQTFCIPLRRRGEANLKASTKLLIIFIPFPQEFFRTLVWWLVILRQKWIIEPFDSEIRRKLDIWRSHPSFFSRFGSRTSSRNVILIWWQLRIWRQIVASPRKLWPSVRSFQMENNFVQEVTIVAPA